MKIIQRISKFFLVAALSICCALGLSSVTFADEVPEYRLQISPAKEDLGELKPGSKATGTFKVQNTGSKSFKFRVSVSPYTVADENYAPQYEQRNQFTDIVEWIEFSQTSGELEPNTEQEIAYTVEVPADVPSGGQYAILIAEIVNDENSTSDSSIASIRRVGMLLYSNVEGHTRKTGSIVENKIPSFLFTPPITASSIVENTGNTHATVKYVLQVYPLFGDEEVFTNEENPMTLTVLPETRRFNEVKWEGSPHLGIFRVKQTVSFWDQSSTTEKVVFLCPIWFLFIILVLIFLVIFWIFSRIRSRRSEA